MKIVEKNISNLIKVNITDELLKAASFLAKQRMVFEYPRKGYGAYNAKNHLINLQYGYIGELSFLKFITKYFSKKYASLSPDDRFEKLKDENFSYNFIIGQTDSGFDFQVKNKEIDVKTYGTKLFSSINNVFKYNLLIDIRQAQTHKADIYIQTFIIGNGKPEQCVLAGFCEGLPPVNYHFPQPAHALSVSKLYTMDELLIKFF